MNRHILVAAAMLLAAGPALAQQTDNTNNAAVKSSAPAKAMMPAKGANSFTEKQARKRLAKAGYMTTSLAKDADGVWTGAATKGGKQVTVGLDFKGNITER